MMKFSPLVLAMAASSLEWATAQGPEHCGSSVHPLTLAGESDPIGEIVITDALNPWHQVNIDVSLEDGFDLTPDPNDDSSPTWITEVRATICCPPPTAVACIEQTFTFPEGKKTASFTMTEPNCDVEFHEHKVDVNVDVDLGKIGGLPALEDIFPVPATFKLRTDHGSNVDASYFDVTFKPGSPFENIQFDGYCVDQDHTIGTNKWYDATAYAYTDIQGYSGTNINNPTDMDLVAWIINAYRPGQSYTGTITEKVNNVLTTFEDTYTMTSGTIQRAVWEIIGDTNGNPGGTWSKGWVDKIVAEARANGEGYVPPPGGYIPIILIPDKNNKQHQMIQATCELLQIPCEPITVTGSAGATAQCTPAPPAGMSGDPHLLTFDGEWFDYNGACDMVLFHVPNFAGGEDDLTVHVRTNMRYDYSYISEAAVQIGEDKLEVEAFGVYSFNDVEGALLHPTLREKKTKAVNDVPTIGGYPIVHTQENKKWHHFEILLPDNQKIKIKSMKDVVSVNLEGATFEYFGKVEGMMGNHRGRLLARDGVTDLKDDINGLADEWQVRSDLDPILFTTARAPQFPQKCVLPDLEAKEARRLGKGIQENEAKAACARAKGNPSAFRNCVYDVTATNDLEQASNY